VKDIGLTRDSEGRYNLATDALISGPDKVAAQYMTILLTGRGTSLRDERLGTGLFPGIVGVANNTLELSSIMGQAVLEATLCMRRLQPVDLPDNERLLKAGLKSYTMDVDRVTAVVVVNTLATRGLNVLVAV